MISKSIYVDELWGRYLDGLMLDSVGYDFEVMHSYFDPLCFRPVGSVLSDYSNIPEHIWSLLRVVYVDGENMLQLLHETITSKRWFAVVLRDLDIDKCHEQVLSVLAGVERVCFRGCDNISSLGFGVLDDLISLDLSGNFLDSDEVSAIISKVKSLKELYIGGVQYDFSLLALIQEKFGRTLEVLSAYRTVDDVFDLEQIEPDFIYGLFRDVNFNSMVSLSLAGLNVDVSVLNDQMNLNAIDVKGNYVSPMSDFSNCLTLNVSSVKCDDVEEVFRTLSCLKMLDCNYVKGDCLRDLKDAVLDLSSLEVVSLAHSNVNIDEVFISKLNSQGVFVLLDSIQYLDVEPLGLDNVHIFDRSSSILRPFSLFESQSFPFIF